MTTKKNLVAWEVLSDGKFKRVCMTEEEIESSRMFYNPETATVEEHCAFYNYMWFNFERYKNRRMRSIINQEVKIILSSYKSGRIPYSRHGLLVDTCERIESKYPYFDPMWIEFYVIKHMAYLTGDPKWMPYRDITLFYIDAFQLLGYVMNQRSPQNIMRGIQSEEKSRKKYLEAILEYLTKRKQFLAYHISE